MRTASLLLTLIFLINLSFPALAEEKQLIDRSTLYEKLDELWRSLEEKEKNREQLFKKMRDTLVEKKDFSKEVEGLGEDIKEIEKLGGEEIKGFLKKLESYKKEKKKSKLVASFPSIEECSLRITGSIEGLKSFKDVLIVQTGDYLSPQTLTIAIRKASLSKEEHGKIISFVQSQSWTCFQFYRRGKIIYQKDPKDAVWGKRVLPENKEISLFPALKEAEKMRGNIKVIGETKIGEAACWIIDVSSSLAQSWLADLEKDLKRKIPAETIKAYMWIEKENFYPRMFEIEASGKEKEGEAVNLKTRIISEFSGFNLSYFKDLSKEGNR